MGSALIKYEQALRHLDGVNGIAEHVGSALITRTSLIELFHRRQPRVGFIVETINAP